MKKLFLFILVAFVSSFASCKKEYTCTCTANAAISLNGNTLSQDFKFYNTKKKAQTSCDAEKTPYSSCTLK